MAILLAVAAVALLALSAVLGPDRGSPWLRAGYLVAQWAGPLLLILLAGYAARRRLATALRRQLVDIAGPALVRAMSPRSVLAALLPWVYGEGMGHQEVLTGVLGGAGRDLAGRDTAVSTSTTAHFRLRAIGAATCESEATWTHEFSGVGDNHKYVIFATHDRVISNLIASERVYPLFELWVVDDEEALEDFVPILRLEVGVGYADSDGVLHTVEPRPFRGQEVALRLYDQFVRLPEWVDRKNLRIVEFDLWDLADPDHVVESIQTLAVRASARGRLDGGYILWSPPHPCFVREITFDVAELAPEGQRLMYLVVPMTMKRGISAKWLEVRDRIECPVDSWLLPGHGVALLWRTIERAEDSAAAQRR